jgi:hypothetical protein
MEKKEIGSMSVHPVGRRSVITLPVLNVCNLSSPMLAGDIACEREEEKS